jgi:hypothetical protein
MILHRSIIVKLTYPPPSPPPPPPGGGVNVFIPSFELLTTVANSAAIESDTEFPEAVATACKDSAVNSAPPMTRHEREETSSSFWASLISATLVKGKLMVTVFISTIIVALGWSSR